ncbi:MAG: ATP-dependent helicase, partial [Bacteroidota bacterium]
MPPNEQNRQDYNERFLETLEGLNAVQKRAVDQIEGPVLVVAGPGTGKTHILAARIGRILMETDAQPNNILCLTFTDAGVIAMRDRLLEFIGPEAHRVHIYTFHSFCNTIIQDNLELFGKQDMEPLSELDRIDLIRNILDRLPMDHALRLGISDIYFYENHLYQLFQQMKMEDWTVDYIHQQIDFYLEDLPNKKEFVYQRRSGTNQKGDLKEAKVEDAIIRMNKLRAAADLYPIYEQAKFEARRYDYSDMILWVLRAFEKEKTLLRNYQEQYLYMLVDEYQDTNGSQNELIQYLATYWEVPNLFIVGDDDQSIYEFQGARLKNLTDIYDRYEEHIELLVLEQNYRSTQHILDVSRQLIDRNQLRIINKIEGKTIQKVLQASHPDRIGEQVAIQIQAFPNRQQEIVAIAEAIKKAKDQGFPLDEIAVIYARHQQVEQLKLLLQKQGIAYQTRRRINVLDTPLIQKILQLLHYFNQEIRRAFSGESLLFEILHFDFLALDSQAIVDLSLSRAAIDWEKQDPWRKHIAQHSKLKSFSTVLEGLIKDSVNFSLPTFVERMYNRLPILAYNLQQDDALEQVQLLVSFLNFAKEEHRKSPNITIGELLKVIQRMQRNRIILPIDAGLDVRNGVQLITAHSAKGLEFEKVYLLDVVKKEWEPQSRGSRFQFTLPDTLTLSGEADELEARRRLFYVAMTRAKKELICTYARFDQKNRPLQRALFVDEVMDAQGVLFSEQEVDLITLMKSQVLQIQTQEEVYIPAQDRATIDALLHPFKLS